MWIYGIMIFFFLSSAFKYILYLSIPEVDRENSISEALGTASL